MESDKHKVITGLAKPLSCDERGSVREGHKI